ncbi:MAG: HD domain-containing protein [Gemmatimonadetes bacterium]|nr:HD domain-containing protein [Gemmatimonadota bacterium]
MTPRSLPVPPRDSRGFCGSSFPWPLIGELEDGADITAVYLVLESRRAETKAAKPYLKLVLGDRTGTIDGVIWDEVDRWEPTCCVEAVVGVRARVGSFQDRLQLRVQSVEILTASADDMGQLLPASQRPLERMERELDSLIASVDDSGLRSLLERFLGAETVSGRAFRSHPAAKRNHHAYLYGLLEHSLSVAAACDRLAAHYAETGIELDRDLLISAALLHDIGKLKELKGFPGVLYTTEGQLLGHIVIGIQMVTREAEALGELSPDRLLHLQHLIASHQGRPEWDSPKVPQTLEALLLHYADDLDAKLNQANALLQSVEEGEWSGYDRSFGRSFLRSPQKGGPAAGSPEPHLIRPREEAEQTGTGMAEPDAGEDQHDAVEGRDDVREVRDGAGEVQDDVSASESDGSVMDLFR